MRWGWRDIAYAVALACPAGLLGFAGAAPAQAQTTATASGSENLQNLSISELANLQVSSATKSTQSLSDAPAALYVITRDAIRRSGLKRLPEILRLAPNLFVAQTGADTFVITARGFAGNIADQAFANKLLVLIDGRSVYDPLFSGVDWQAVDVPPDDIDRIEVISGPGAVLWGADAFNGVINIITRKSYETLGGFADVTAGTEDSTATVRVGGRINDDLTVRAYVRELLMGDLDTATGARVDDHAARTQGGFRFDWTPSATDALMLEGDGYYALQAQPAAPDATLNGFDLDARWDHQQRNGGEFQALAYINSQSFGPSSIGALPNRFVSFDVEAQDNFNLGSRQRFVVGGGFRDTWYNIGATPDFFYVPPSGSLVLGDIFGQDTISLTPSLNLILGLKIEGDTFVGVTPLPSVRATWRIDPGLLVWASAQKAIRAPTPFDRDPVEEVENMVVLTGDPDFMSETLVAYEIGLRTQISQQASLSVSTFYNVYGDLRTLEFRPGHSLPMLWGNGLQGDAYGLEAWGDLQVASWWRLSGGVDLLSKHLHFAPGASGLLGVAQAGDDPAVQGSLRSAMDLAPNLTFDAEFRSVGDLPDPFVPAYSELNLSLDWHITRRLALGIAGFNLLHKFHQEFMPPAGAVPRSGQIELRAHF